MDKYEFKLSLNEINTLIDERRFDEAAGIADKIDWNRVKSANTLCRISEVYKIVGDYDRSRDIMAIAYQRQPNNPAIVYALCELTIYLYNRDGMQSDLTRSLQLLNEYQKMEPGNPKRHILQYKMYCASPVSNDEKIAVLKQLHEEKPSARWDYELAKVYADAGMKNEAESAARDVIQRYSGKFADKAQDLLENLGRLESSTETASEENNVRQEERTAGEEKPEPEQPVDERRAEIDQEENESAERTAAELEQQAEKEKAEEEPAQNIDSHEDRHEENADAGVQQELPITTPEEQHGVDSLQNNVANGMKDILARPYDDKLEQETNGQYAMVMDQPAKQDDQVAGQMSISEVMAEWEKIRSDIRKANDQKRAQRILEDTGSLLADFDETARHGLLEDIEKGVAKQRRQVRSGAYRVSDALPQDRQVQPEEEEENNRQADQYEDAEDGRRRNYDDGQNRYEEEERPVRNGGQTPEVFDSEDGYYDDEDESIEEHPAERRIPVTAEEYNSADKAASQEQQPGYDDRDEEVYRDQPADYREQPEDQQEPEPEGDEISGQEPVKEAKRGEPRREADRYRSPREDDEIDDVATRRWNSEEIHRAMARQEQLAREEELENAKAHKEERRRRRHVKAVPAPEPEYEEEEELPEEEAPQDNRGEEIQKQPAEEAAEEEVPEEELPEEEPAPEEGDERADSGINEEESLEEPEDEPAETADEKEQEPAGTADEEEPAEEEPSEVEAEEKSHKSAVSQRRPERQTKKEEEAAIDENSEGENTHQKGRRELTREERRLFGPFCRMKANVNQLLDALDQISLASSTGNLMILGNEATADRVAKGILEIQRHSDSNFTGKIAKVSGGSLNKLDAGGFTRTFAKLENGALIINKAADIAPKTMERLYQELEGRDHGIILIMTDTNKKMEQFRRENAKYLESFTAVINIRPLDDKALVAYARDYAMSQDYSIDEFGQLALAQRISTMQTSTHRVTLKEVRDLVDEAISYASRKTPHTLMEIISRKRYDENDRIIIHEKDFQHN